MKKTIIKWACAFLAAIILVGATAVVSFWAAKKSFEDEAFVVKSNKISFDEEKVDEDLIAKFKEIKRRIGEEYFLEYDENDLVEGSIAGMVEGLNDPYTQYFSKEEMESWNNRLQGDTEGDSVEQSVFSELLGDGVGYLRIASFDANAASNFETEVNGLLTGGMQSMILDLRDNVGGLASVMTLIADSVLPDGAMIYYEVDKAGERTQVKYSDAKALNIPIVVLVNDRTASVAEVLASTLRDNVDATLVGTKTCGKAVAQVTIPFSDGTGLVLAVAQYYTPSEYSIQDNGLAPDSVVEPMDEYKNTKVQYIPRENDVQLTAAMELLSGAKSDE